MTVDGFGGKVSAAAAVPEVSELHGNEAGHWRLLSAAVTSRRRAVVLCISGSNGRQRLVTGGGRR